MQQKEPQTYTFQLVAPIPIGHRVEIQFFATSPAAFFKKEPPQVKEHEPHIRDLDTGVVYANHWHYSGSTGVQQGSVTVYPAQLHQSLQVAGVVIGRVLHCRVLTEWVASLFRVQTTITVAPEPDGAPYRG